MPAPGDSMVTPRQVNRARRCGGSCATYLVISPVPAGRTRHRRHLGTSVAGSDDKLLPVLGEIMVAAFAHGATRVTMQVEHDD